MHGRAANQVPGCPSCCAAHACTPRATAAANRPVPGSRLDRAAIPGSAVVALPAVRCDRDLVDQHAIKHSGSRVPSARAGNPGRQPDRAAIPGGDLSLRNARLTPRRPPGRRSGATAAWLPTRAHLSGRSWAEGCGALLCRSTAGQRSGLAVGCHVQGGPDPHARARRGRPSMRPHRTAPNCRRTWRSHALFSAAARSGGTPCPLRRYGRARRRRRGRA